MHYARSIFTFALFLLPLFAHAQNTLYTTPLTRIPGITDEQTLSNISTYGLAGFLNGVITFTFTAAAIASVIMIVIIGFQYVTTEKSGPNVSALREKITSVAFGVALIASMYIVFKFINPDIVDSLNILSSAADLPKVEFSAPNRTTKTNSNNGGNSGSSLGTGSGDSAGNFTNEMNGPAKITEASGLLKGFGTTFTTDSKEAVQAAAESYAKEVSAECKSFGGTMRVYYTESGINRYLAECRIASKN